MSEYRWLNEASQQFLERDYLVEGQTVDERVTEIAESAEKILNKPGYANKFKNYFKKGWFSLSTPIWVNFGNDRGLPISCFSSHIDDCMQSIAYTWAEVAMMTKYGGGTSGYFGDLRGRGSKISNNGVSSGSVHFMSAFDNLISVISQGKARRGNFAAYLPIDHDDIEEFLDLRSEGNPIQDLSFGVCVPNYWMESMINGDMEKRAVWAKVLTSRTNTGYPYIFFTDNVNRGTVDVYKDKDMKITHSNLCVTGDQRVVTSTGMRTVKDLYETQESLTLFDGHNKVSASPMRLIEKNAPVYEILTVGGRSHKVTGYHKIKTDYGMVEAQDLAPGDKIGVQIKKGLFGEVHEPEKAFLLGLYQGDGTQTDASIHIDIWEYNFDLIPEIRACLTHMYEKNDWMRYKINNQYMKTDCYRVSKVPKFLKQKASENGVKKQRLSSNKLKQDGFEKGFIPEWIWRADEETQWQYIRGLLITDGSVTLTPSKNKGNPIQVSFSNTNYEWLQEIQILMSNLGLKPKIHNLLPAGRRLLPDGKGGRKEYECKESFRLIMSNKPDALLIEKNTGFLTRKSVFLEDREYRDNTKKFDKVKEVRFFGYENVYCTTVDSDEHVWVCNSIITSNCSEIMLPCSEDESFVCDLSSMNILHYDEWKDTDAVEVVVYLLDAVMSEFIEKARNIQFMERAVRFAERHRALGVGWLGWHSYLQSKMIPFESFEAKLQNTQIAKTIFDQTYKASQKLAQEYGEPELLQGYGRRNTTLLSVAPTKSSAAILGWVSEGIEPYRTNYYMKDLAKGKYQIKNQQLEKLLESKNKNTDEVWKSIQKYGGSVQHLDFLDNHEKSVFKTFSEISQMEVIIQAAQRQKFIDQGQSLNLMIHPSTPTKELNALMIEAWKLGIKSLYYQHSVNSAQEFRRNLLNCVSCEA